MYDIRKNKDGSIDTIPRRITKQIVVAGQIVTMVSLDGIAWVMEAHEQAEITRQNRLEALQAARVAKINNKDEITPKEAEIKRKGVGGWLRDKKKDFDARINKGKIKAPIPPVLEYHGEPLIGKDQGKKQKYRRNLRKRVPARVVHGASIHKYANPVHFHNCHGINHPMKEGLTRFSCACESPKKRRYCGTTFCLYD